jgi:hypothetical protein
VEEEEVIGGTSVAAYSTQNRHRSGYADESQTNTAALQAPSTTCPPTWWKYTNMNAGSWSITTSFRI